MSIEMDQHRELAKQLNGVVWTLLAKSGRTETDAYRMIHTAHASLWHWLQAGSVVHEQRGEWLVARVYAELGHAGAALRHAQRCMAITERHASEMQDFDVAYAHEGLARARAAYGDAEAARSLKRKARELGDEIGDEEDRAIFDNDFHEGDWHGML